MEIIKIFKGLSKDKRAVTAVTLLGISGLGLIMLSSLIPEKSDSKSSSEKGESGYTAEEYREETEKRLESFIEKIEGVGEAEVYLTIAGEEKYEYATEGRTMKAENKTEEEHSYVMTGASGNKTALVETVNFPEISGAVVVCTGGNSPLVQETVYEAVSTALGIPTGRIYVTKLR
ncbi:MAG: hypothetical protein IJO99_03390 [Ruminococcus sp.]|nr:hypothetical protein [Ruminococcus sp.]MBR6792185.1 hypothetical protein [Ruminococcus sp.]